MLHVFRIRNVLLHNNNNGGGGGIRRMSRFPYTALSLRWITELYNLVLGFYFTDLYWALGIGF